MGKFKGEHVLLRGQSLLQSRALMVFALSLLIFGPGLFTLPAAGAEVGKSRSAFEACGISLPGLN